MLTRTTIVLGLLAKPFLVCNPQPLPAQVDDESSGTETTDTTETTVDPTDTEPTDTGPTSTTTVDPMCGNGMKEGDEECDDGNDDPADACLNNCKNAACGDDQVRADDMPEECDDGDQVDTNMCTSACKLNICSDGFVLEGTEECDDGNDVNDDECTNDCKLPVCGDGMKTGTEECDDGANNAPKDQATPEQCTTECKIACADGTQSSMEECDDGNLEANDGCSATCTDEYIMFVTATDHPATFGGVAAADEFCQTAATGKLMGTYVAWLSVMGDNARDDIPGGKPMIRPDGMLIVEAAQELFMNGLGTTLSNKIELDVDGNVVAGYAWTGTSETGEALGTNCGGWTKGQAQLATIGSVESLTSQWTFASDIDPGLASCDKSYHLYCFRKLDP